LNESDETLNSKIDSVCNEAIAKADKLKQEEKDGQENINKKKKELVVEFAERLDKLLPQKDAISSKIVKTLKGRVSKSLIHACLPAKYKQEHRIKNALKQKKKKKNIKEELKLAPLVALNPRKEETEKKKTKVEVMAGTDGRSYIQREGDGKTSENEPKDYPDSSFKDNTSNQASTTASQQTEQERQLIDHEDRFDSELARQKLNNITYQNIEQEGNLEKPTSLTNTLNKSEIAEGASVEQSFENGENVLSIEFPVPFNYLQSRIGQLRSKIDGNGIVWVKTVINLDTSKVIIYDLGDRKHQNVAAKSRRNNASTKYTAGHRENGQ